MLYSLECLISSILDHITPVLSDEAWKAWYLSMQLPLLSDAEGWKGLGVRVSFLLCLCSLLYVYVVIN